MPKGERTAIQFGRGAVVLCLCLLLSLSFGVTFVMSSAKAENVKVPSRRIDVKRAGFSFFLPNGMTEVPASGVDSLVLTFEGPNLKLLMDYGAYSDPLKHIPPGVVELKVREEVINGKLARIVTYLFPHEAQVSDPEFPYFVGAHFADLGRGPQFKLSITGRASDRNGQRLGLQAVRSIHFSDSSQ